MVESLGSVVITSNLPKPSSQYNKVNYKYSYIVAR